MMTDGVARAAFIVSLVFLFSVGLFAFGVAVGKYRIWPHDPLEQMHQTTKAVVKYGQVVPENLIVEPPPDAPRERFVVSRSERLSDGFYVFVGWSEERQSYVAWLYSSAQELLHEWQIDYDMLDPDGPLNGSDSPHATAVLNDGSILVGFDKGDVLARIDVCGSPIWTKPGVYHHSLDQAEDGSFWVWRGTGTAYGHYNVLENFDPITGRTERELELVEDIIKKSAEAAAAFTVTRDYDFREFEADPDDSYDIFHPNDIEELESDLADKFPDFEAGDLLLSFRNIHLVAVVDGETGDMKWANHGPWRFQHDPDFTDDGKISVYNNNISRGRSGILKIDPTTREVSNELVSGEFAFYTTSMGKHQYLPNGNILIVVPGEGRIAEVTGSGEMVLEFNNVSREAEAYNMHVTDALWHPLDYFDRLPECLKAEQAEGSSPD